MSKYNYFILSVMFFACVSMFAFFPFLVTIINDSYSFSAEDIGLMMLCGTVLGNIFALLASLKIRPSSYKLILVLSLFLFSISSIGFNFFSSHHSVFIWIYLIALVLIYRMSIGIYYNITRILQINALTNEAFKPKLLSSIKLVNSLGGALGPILGQSLMHSGGYSLLLNVTSLIFFLLFIVTSIMLFFGGNSMVKMEKDEKGKNDRPNIFNKIVKDRKYIFITLGATFHYIFEAQIYTYMALTFKKGGQDHWIALLFTMNSIILIVLASLGVRYHSFLNEKPKFFIILSGSIASCIALVFTPFVNGLILLFIVTLLFSIGEYLTPQWSLDVITNRGACNFQKINGFNFMTRAIGMGGGFYIGSVAIGINSVLISSIIWLTIMGLSFLCYLYGFSFKNQ